MQITKALILAAVIGLLSKPSLAENKNDIRKFELDKEYHFTNPTESHGSPTKEVVLIKGGTQDSLPTDSELGLKTLGAKNTYFLKLKVACIDKQLPISNIPSNKNLKWNLKLADDKVLSGDSRTDNQGIVSITINTKDSLANKKIQIELKDTIENIDLSKGPFEVLFPLEACKK